jgi:hypothetical protein
MDWEDYRGLEVKQMNDTVADVPEIRLAAWWNEDIMMTSLQPFAVWRRGLHSARWHVAQQGCDLLGSPGQPGHMDSLLPP